MTEEKRLCSLCPRNCMVDRSYEKGYCSMPDEIKIARRALHFWEEPCLSGDRGSGAVFFSGCNMKCVFCQNRDISHEGFGKVITPERLTEIFLELQEQGALNINLVTPTHYSDHIIRAVRNARKKGLTLPVLYNTSCYETVEAVKSLEGTVDIWLPDFKYYHNETRMRYSSCPDYVERAKDALDEMVRQCPRPVFDSDGIMQKGVIVRILVLPEHAQEAKEIVDYLYDRYGNSIYISLMSQYTPFGDLSAFPEIDRTLTQEEYDRVVDHAVEIGVENGFIQEGAAASESFIPSFDLRGVDRQSPDEA